ncbi:MAG: ATP-binding cassette domain-containing protein [bacterium]|nr:ATP-binding cassette domain-containing protein [bacterium]
MPSDDQSAKIDRPIVRHASRTLEQFAKAAKVSFNRNLADRVVGEAQESIQGEDWLTWARRLVEVGESLSLRVRSMEANLADALVFVQQGIPVAAPIDTGDTELDWTLITQVSGRRARIISGANADDEQWVSIASLRKRIAAGDNDGKRFWVIGQAALPCEGACADSAGTSGEAVSPFQRLVGLMRPEVSDLWVMGIFSVVVGVLALAAPITVEALVNTVAFGKYLQPVIVLALLLFTFLAFAGGMRALITFVVEILQRRLFVRVVEDLAYRLPRVRREEFDKAYGPELANRFFDIVTVQKTVSSLLVDGISIILQTFIGMAVLAFYHPYLLGFDVALLILIAVVIFGLGWGSISSAVKESKKKYAIADWLEELTRHPTAFKLHSGSQFALDRADQLAVDWLDARRDHFHVVMRQFMFALGLQAIASTALLGIGGWLVIVGEITLGQLVAAELIVMMIVGSFTKLGKHLESFYDLLASVDKLGHLFDLQVEAHDKLFHLRTAEPASLVMRNVSYKYRSHTAINDLSFDVKPGESIGVQGAAGEGKTTLIEVLSGMRSPSSGYVELDSVDMRELRPDSLREHLALAQSIEIFHGTVAENIHLNRPNLNSSDVQNALNEVKLHDEIRNLPDGLNTMLQTNGAPLSQSQAARVMIARALVGHPRLLLIDGTLDLVAEDIAHAIMENLAGENRPWTLCIASNRDEIFTHCDRVLPLGRPRRSVGVNAKIL